MSPHREPFMSRAKDQTDSADQDSISCRTSVSAGSTVELSSSPDSSIVASPPCEEIPQALMAYGIPSPKSVGSPDALAISNDCTEGPKYRCMDDTHKNRGPTFKSERDLKRHWKIHDPDAPIWFCGCCQNLGKKFKGKIRKDKVQDHLRRIHDPKSGGTPNPGTICLKEDCLMLFTSASCLDEHLRQVHPSLLPTTPRQNTNGKTCDCMQKLESKRLLENVESGTKKHRAGSPLQSIAKRGRYAPVERQPLELSQQCPIFETNPSSSFMEPWAQMSFGLTESPWPLFNDAFPNSMNETQDFGFSNMAPQLGVNSWTPAITPTSPGCIEGETLNEHIGIDRSLPPLDQFDLCPQGFYAQTPPSRLSLGDSKPAEFLAIRKTQDFQNIALYLRLANQHYPCAPTSPITYNPVMEIITLTGCSESKLIKARKDLQLLVETFSGRWGWKYLMTSQASTSRAQVLDSPRSRSSASSENAKVFPIRPKDHRQLVHLWFESLLPALPQILSERLGGNYSASLGLRGRIPIRAKPCIQIESPCLPALTARRMIEDDISGVCKRGAVEPLSVYFTEGSVRKLNGGDEEYGEDDYVESAVVKQLEFSYGRPYSKLVMGASVGVLYSERVSASLGGFILMDGQKYMLTSDHFISESQTAGKKDGDIPICDTIISPSRQELNTLKENLKQTKRELVSDLNLSTKKTYGNIEVPQEDFSENPRADIEMSIRDVDQLLDQVTKSPRQYAVGSVINHSIEPRSSGQLSYAMDWALVKLETRTVQNAENRHKYQSNEDARNDQYVEERDHVYRPGDVCHETCDAESAITVSYVGHRSKRRSGITNLPTLISIDNSVTHAWGIQNSDGELIPYSDVAGDCGAWVIRTTGNMLMGQVLFHSQGRVLFIPANDIFADLKSACGADVSLPPPPDPGQVSHVPSALPLCSEPGTPPIKSYRFLKPDLMALNASPKTLPIETAFPDTRTIESPTEMTLPSDTEITNGQGFSDPCESPLSLPSLTDSPQSSATTPEDPKSPLSLSFGDADIPNGKEMSSEYFPTMLGEPTMSEIPELSLHKQAQAVGVGICEFEFNAPPLFRISSGSRVPLWQARRGFGTSLRHHAKPSSARPFFDKVTGFGRIIEEITDMDTASCPLA